MYHGQRPLYPAYMFAQGGGYYPPPGATFGYGGNATGTYNRAAGALFGYGHQARLSPAMVEQPQQIVAVPNGPGPCDVPPPCGPQQALYPNMPPLSGAAWQQVAACTLCGAQQEADKLKSAFGVDSGGVLLIAAGASATILVRPQKTMIPERLVMSETMAGNFLITDIDAGVESLLATTGPISAALFVQDSTVLALKSVMMTVGMDFSVGVTNITGAPLRFTTTVVGKPVPPTLH